MASRVLAMLSRMWWRWCREFRGWMKVLHKVRRGKRVWSFARCTRQMYYSWHTCPTWPHILGRLVHLLFLWPLFRPTYFRPIPSEVEEWVLAKASTPRRDHIRYSDWLVPEEEAVLRHRISPCLGTSSALDTCACMEPWVRQNQCNYRKLKEWSAGNSQWSREVVILLLCDQLSTLSSRCVSKIDKILLLPLPRRQYPRGLRESPSPKGAAGIGCVRYHRFDVCGDKELRTTKKMQCIFYFFWVRAVT